MKMNRRNVVIGIGALVGAGGAALGSGAFSQAEAQRDVNITVEGDGAAVVQIEVLESQSDVLSDGGGDQISLDVDNVYQDAKVLIAPALRFTNTSSDDQYNVTLESDTDVISEFTAPDDTSLESTTDTSDFDLDTNGSGDEETEVGIVIETGSSDTTNTDELIVTITETTI